MSRAEHQALREEVAAVARRLVSSGLVTGTSGNVGARTREGDVLITPSGLSYEFMDPESIVLVGPDGKQLEGSLLPSSETPMRTGIYKARPNVGAVVRPHSRSATTLACPGWPIPPVHYMLTTLGPDGRVPLAPYALYETEKPSRSCSERSGRAAQGLPVRAPWHINGRRRRGGGLREQRHSGGDGGALLPRPAGRGAQTARSEPGDRGS